MLFSLLRLVTLSRTPLVTVVSGSMEPAFQRGDLLILWNRSEISVGDIPVVWFQGYPMPMVHRTIKTVDEAGMEETEGQFLTKGDNNQFDDLELYPPGRELVRRGEVVGNVVGYVPAIGWPALWIMDLRTGLSRRLPMWQQASWDSELIWRDGEGEPGSDFLTA
ncbi:signal peptidase I [Rhinocladiella mackenziei CBS 650.93]|uniref:Signal peptidase complex catalytic subunit SEC11 n=1 Tax=Rhinocladiella mackenziei CBS 650.93 TaxID=1442369 RepID=A0A0D2IGB5_9EURO|nr:signal peptidase I [Rhinocladiella mackenziei CBS 650.93]KIX02316.1 signal peptidase I [Rhinocladiella mackenziei CBS 650.93]